jgi:hypothetical protein
MSAPLTLLIFAMDRVRTVLLALSLIVLAKIAFILITPVAG